MVTQSVSLTRIWLPVVTLSGMQGSITVHEDGSAQWKGLAPNEAYMMCDPFGLGSLDRWMQKVAECGWDANPPD